MENIIYCRNFALIDNQLASANYPSRILSPLEWKLLIHFNVVSNCIYGNSYHGHQSFSKKYTCTRIEYKSAIHRLEEMHFIRTWKYTPRSKHTYTAVLLTPMFDIETGYLGEALSDKFNYAVNYNKIHFSMVPSEPLLQLLSSELDAILILIKLYRYHHPLYNGIDPNVLRRDAEGLYIHPRLLFSIGLSFEDFRYHLEVTLRNYFLERSVNVFPEQFDHDVRLRLATAQPNPVPITMFTPIYQYQEEAA